MGKVRAKFRVMNIEGCWNGKLTVVRLLPVDAKARPDEGLYIDPEASEENRLFWEATPSGECRLVYGTIEAGKVPFVLGQCYYLDLDLGGQEGIPEWKLGQVTEHERQLDVEFFLSWDGERSPQSGSLTMQIQNQDAWPYFKGRPGTSWSLEIMPEGG